MCVADHFELDDPESPLLAQSRAAWKHWCADDPDLAVVDDLINLRDWTRRAQAAVKDPVLARLAILARDDVTARTALVWLLIPGATALADRLGDLSTEIDGLVAGQLWIEVSRSHHLGPRGIAQAILNETRRQVTADLGVGNQAKLRDKIWTEVRLLDHFDERAVLVEPMEPDAEYEVLELLDAAPRHRRLRHLAAARAGHRGVGGGSTDAAWPLWVDVTLGGRTSRAYPAGGSAHVASPGVQGDRPTQGVRRSEDRR